MSKSEKMANEHDLYPFKISSSRTGRIFLLAQKILSTFLYFLKLKKRKPSMNRPVHNYAIEYYRGIKY